MANKRIFWAVTALGVSSDYSIVPGSVTVRGGESAATTQTAGGALFVPGVQSVGISTTFNLEQVFELGQLQIYQDVEEVPDIEITVERVVDENMCLYQRVMGQATDGGSHKLSATAITIPANQNNRVDVFFEVHPDTKESVGDQMGAGAGTPKESWVWCSGMYCSSASWNFATDGNFTESTTLVGNHKKWYGTNDLHVAMLGVPLTASLDSGAVKRRQHIYFANTPASIGGAGALAVNSVAISTDFGRETINVMGQKMPYHRFVTFPVEVTCDIELTITDLIAQDMDADPYVDNLSEETIKLIVTNIPPTDIDTAGAATAVHTFDLGTKNKLTSLTYGGGDTGGANATMSYSYRNFNALTYTYGGTQYSDHSTTLES